MMRSTQENIAYLRSIGYSQSRIAESLGTTQPLICRWENGVVPASADIALRLAELAAKAAVDAQTKTEPTSEAA